MALRGGVNRRVDADEDDIETIAQQIGQGRRVGHRLFLHYDAAMESKKSAIAELTRMIAQAKRAVVFTGAGISTESGVPDFRSPGGIWTRMKPIYFQEFVAREEKRRESWERTFSGAM